MATSRNAGRQLRVNPLYRVAQWKRSSLTIEHRILRDGNLAVPGHESRVWAGKDPERPGRQMYFPGDPLFAFDSIFHAVRDAQARERMIAKFDLDATRPDWALGFRYDIVLRGPQETPMEEGR